MQFVLTMDRFFSFIFNASVTLNGAQILCSNPVEGKFLQDSDRHARVFLKVDLEYADGKVVCHPSLDEVSQNLLQKLDDVALRMKEVQDECMGAVQCTLNAPPVSPDGWCCEPTFKACRSVIKLPGNVYISNTVIPASHVCRDKVKEGITAFLNSVCAVRDVFAELSADLDYSLEELLQEFEGSALDRYDQRISFFESQIEAVNGTDTQVLSGIRTCPTFVSALTPPYNAGDSWNICCQQWANKVCPGASHYWIQGRPSQTCFRPSVQGKSRNDCVFRAATSKSTATSTNHRGVLATV